MVASSLPGSKAIMKYSQTFVAFTCLLLCFGSAAQADNSTCTNATLLVPDGSSHVGNIPALSAGGTNKWYRFVAKANRSYALMLENLTSPDQQAEIFGSFA